MEDTMIYIILALIVIVAAALWRSSAQQKKSRHGEITNRYKPKAKAKRVKIKKEKAQPVAANNTIQKRVYRTEAINLHHPAHHSDDLSKSDQALGLEAAAEIHINAGEPVLLYLVAPQDKPFHGFNLIQNLLSTGLKLHKNGIFDRLFQTREGSEKLFQVASMKEPGTFPTSQVDQYETPGLVFYLQPGKDVQIFKQRFDTMLSQMTLVQSRIGGHIFTPDKTLLEAHDFHRYADYLISLGEITQEA